MQQLNSAFFALKSYSERILIICLVSSILLTSAISWGKLLTNDSRSMTFENNSKTTQNVKNKVVLFSGLMLVVAEYFNTEE